MKKYISVCLLAALLTSLAACGGDVGVTDSTDTTAVDTTTDTATVSDLPDMDWGGEEFHVLGLQNTSSTQFSTFEVAVESENGDVVNDAIYRRNVAVEDRYNVKIVETKHNANTGGDAMADVIRKAVLADEDIYDLAFCAIDGIGKLAREGILYDLNELDYIDFSKAWWNPEVNERIEVEDRLFFANSAFTLRDKNRVYILNFNKRLVEEHQLPNYFDAVRDGTWTLDMLKAGCTAVANDINGNGEVDTDDVFGIVLDSYNGGCALATGAGLQTLKTTEAGYEIAINTERTVDILDKVLSITAGDYIGSSCDEWKGKTLPESWSSYWSFSGQTYNAGRALFITGFPHSLASRSANSTDDYGILPFPKYDEAQEEYINMADRYSMLVGIPSSSQTPDFSAFMLEALSAEAYTTSYPAYIEVSCKTKYTYDEDSADMLDIIFSNIYYEPALVWTVSGIRSIVYNIIEAKENTFASEYASIESKAQTRLNEVREDIRAYGQK